MAQVRGYAAQKKVQCVGTQRNRRRSVGYATQTKVHCGDTQGAEEEVAKVRKQRDSIGAYLHRGT